MVLVWLSSSVASSFFSARRETGEIEVAHQIGGVLRGAFKIDAQANFMQLAGAGEQLAAERFQLPGIVQLIHQMRCELGYTLGLLGVDHEAALNIAQRTATDILIDGQMQHAVNQAFTERTAREVIH